MLLHPFGMSVISVIRYTLDVLDPDVCTLMVNATNRSARTGALSSTIILIYHSTGQGYMMSPHQVKWETALHGRKYSPIEGNIYRA